MTSVLHKGLKFVPTPPPTPRQTLLTASRKFTRLMHLRYHFRNQPHTPQHPFRTPSSWDPPTPPNHTLRTYTNTITHQITNTPTPPHTNTPNLTPSERTALKQLSQLPHTIIKPADKGGAIVLWDTKDYLLEANIQLNDTNYYSTVSHDHIPSLAHNISLYIHQLLQDNIIDEPTHDFLLPHTPPRTPQFYMLPKIHKPHTPGRPIISGCQSPTEKLSIFLDHYLKKFVPHIPSYIKDTTHFLQTVLSLPTPLPDTCFLVTIDVASLYTNIPHEEGIAAALSYIQTLPAHKRPPIHVFRSLLNYILKHNYFKFDNKHYLQLRGTAMGTRMAPSYTNLFMASVEHQLLRNNPLPHSPHTWLRFIDDIFMIWTHDEPSLLNFLQYINSIHPTIKFTHEYSPTRINFLDTYIHVTPQHTLISSLYTKPTDSTLLLHYHSHHPLSCKHSVVYSQALRYRRITTDTNTYKSQLLTLRRILLSRGYPDHVIHTAFTKASHYTQHQLLFPNTPTATPTTTPTPPAIPFITQFNHNTSTIPRILHANWELISSDQELSSIFPSPPTTAFTRHKNLKDTLVHSSHPRHTLHRYTLQHITTFTTSHTLHQHHINSNHKSESNEMYAEGSNTPYPLQASQSPKTIHHYQDPQEQTNSPSTEI
ncbi:uncharacterized protein LOC116608371 [Nematostella vectensis]|uniref:uncharacterized protein LOC116608371 n=1 Tax=Nematostella vectensis TaxID=45351 RepID=UPI0020776C2A|nr:uncharacterized protein LOC116608371 [Nematostella vectensis]